MRVVGAKCWWTALMHVSQILLFVDIVSSCSIQPVRSGWVYSVVEVVVTAMLSFEELSSIICLHVNIVWRIEVDDLPL